MKAIPAGLLPLPTADFSYGTRIEIVLEEETSRQYVEEFDNGDFIDVAEIRGFLNLLLTADGTLALRGRRTQDSQAILIYHFWSQQPLSEATVMARCAAPNFARAENELAVSVDRRQWSLVSQVQHDGASQLRVATPGGAWFQEFWVRLTMCNHMNDREKIANVCDRITVQYKFAQ